MEAPKINEGKQCKIVCGGKEYYRWAIRTPVISREDDLIQVVGQYAAPYLKPEDILFLSEKMVATTQGRAIPLEEIHPRPLARFLCKFVRKTPYGIGLAMPETMEMALRECGTIRILIAAAVSAVGKLFGRRGWFYVIAGEKAAAIDGPCEYTLPPLNKAVVLAPHSPDEVAQLLSKAFGGQQILIVDINDLGGKILGAYPPSLDREFYAAVLKDNPLGQSDQRTPMGIIRTTPEPPCVPENNIQPQAPSQPASEDASQKS